MVRWSIITIALFGLLLTQVTEIDAQSAKQIRQAQKECRVLSDDLRGIDWYYYRKSPFPRIDADKDFVSLYFAVIHGHDGKRLSPLFFRFQTRQRQLSSWIFTQQILVKDLASDLPAYVIEPPPGTVIQAVHPYGYSVYEAYDYRTAITQEQLLGTEPCTEAILYRHLCGKKARIQYIGKREAKPLEVYYEERDGLLLVKWLYQDMVEKGMPIDIDISVEPPVKIGLD